MAYVSYGNRCSGYVVDVFDDGSRWNLYFNIEGMVDILINNVGGGGSWNTYMDVMKINYDMTVFFTKHFISNMQEKGWGRVITIGSIYSKQSSVNHSYFSAAKSAQLAYMKSMSKDRKYVRSGITFNTVLPGHISCGNHYEKNKDEKTFKEYIEKTPMGRIGTPKDVANAVKFLCSDEADYVNGSCITVDGGESSWI